MYIVTGAVARAAAAAATLFFIASCSGCGTTTGHVGSASPSPAASADELFAQSCKQFRGDAAVDILLNGFDKRDIARINAALDLAKQAAETDEPRYGDYARTFQQFAEGMGQYVAVMNDPNSSYEDVFKAAGKVPFPASSPDCPPDSGGLPLPSETSNE